jgi:uncharacterized protein (TIGR00661 family)
MKILYGVAGVGLGHSSRASTIIKHLESKGHQIKIITYGQALRVLKKDFDVFKANGPNMVFKRGILKKRLTLKDNLENLPRNLRRWKKFHTLMQDFSPDICISDMDPLVPILSNWYSLPLISIDNQHRLTNLKLKIPKEHYKEYLIAKNVVKTFVRKADAFIITSFAKAPVRKPKTFLVPPILRPEILKANPSQKNHILVYLSRKDPSILKILKKIPEKFTIYGYNKNSISNNLHFKTKETFLSDLESCNAVIATAGFTLICESLYLKKPYLAIPLKGQFEQVLNCLQLQASGFGNYTENLNKEDINQFLSDLKKYKTKLQKYKPDNFKLLKVLDSQIK